MQVIYRAPTPPSVTVFYVRTPEYTTPPPHPVISPRPPRDRPLNFQRRYYNIMLHPLPTRAMYIIYHYCMSNSCSRYHIIPYTYTPKGNIWFYNHSTRPVYSMVCNVYNMVCDYFHSSQSVGQKKSHYIVK